MRRYVRESFRTVRHCLTLPTRETKDLVLRPPALQSPWGACSGRFFEVDWRLLGLQPRPYLTCRDAYRESRVISILFAHLTRPRSVSRNPTAWAIRRSQQPVRVRAVPSPSGAELQLLFRGIAKLDYVRHSVLALGHFASHGCYFLCVSVSRASHGSWIIRTGIAHRHAGLPCGIPPPP
ncbi:hypothetical protein TgHK011_009313 [Trichoderma gracile]|nr:hypothetical protein TgHK011_009313 [Trichoderma gracile]